jgi:haloacetate dehalogenase
MIGFSSFDLRQWTLNGSRINARVSKGAPSAARPPLVLLHGFPETHVMWRRIAEQLKDAYHLVLPDLRGYGDSAQLPGDADHANYSKRAMAADVIALLDELGIDSFFLCGHDRGARVAHRLALDHAARVRRLCVVDVAPTLDMHEATDAAFAQVTAPAAAGAEGPGAPWRAPRGC